MTKKAVAIYRMHGVEVRDGKLVTPDGELMTPPLQPGNDKLGKVWTWSTLPTNELFDTSFGVIAGTCKCTCKGCYARRGHYARRSVIDALAIRTKVSRKYPNWLLSAICAQLESIGREVEMRISAAGDVEDSMIPVWQEIERRFSGNFSWTYTKNDNFKSAFDSFRNANIVKSVIEGFGYNFGPIEYLFRAYIYIVEVLGKTPYICRCGIDNKQHCEGCKGCLMHEYVLFGEHSTAYKIKKDPRYNDFVRIVEMQKGHTAQEICAEIHKLI